MTGNPFIWAVLYLLATVLVGGLLAWPVSLVLSASSDVPFQRVLSRTLALTLLVFALVYLRATGGLSRQQVGFGADRRTFLRAVTVNFALGLLAIAPLVALLFVIGVRAWASVDDTVVALASLALSTGLVVGLLEETYFRGLVLLAALRRGRSRPALVATSLLFALVHFLVPREDPEAVRWYSSFELVAAGLATLGQPATIGAFAALTAAGLMLGAMRLRHGHLGSCVGFHAGWVTGYTLTHRLTDVTATDASYWLIGPDGVLGWLAFLWISALLIAYVLFKSRAG